MTNKTKLSSAAVADLKTAQRLFRISPSYSTVEAMKAAGYLSAQSVYFTGRDNFIAAMTGSFGGAPLAEMAFARAEMTYGATLTTFGRYNSGFNRIHLSVMAPSAPDPDDIANLPDLQALFGSLDSFECEECQSVFSPAAYLVDLLQYLKQFSANGGGVTCARDALLLRRPDIQYIALDCNNTNIALPYIDLVNEILEAVIAPPDPPASVIETTGTSEERRAIPQQILQPAYVLTGQAVFPLILPFDLPFAETTAYIGALGMTRAAVLGLFAGNPVPANAAPSLACASLQINPEMQAVINGSDTSMKWERWGLAEIPASVIDPETRNPYVPNPPDWVAALSKVPVLLNRTGLSVLQLYQLLEVAWVTESAVTLKAGITTIAGVDVLSPSLDDMVFIGLTDDVLDRANRFLRLWKACGLQMWELDWALEAALGGALDDSFLVFLTNAITVQKQLKLPFQELLSFWMPLETRDVINHLGAEDGVASSTYSRVFRDAAVLMSSGDIFIPAGKNVITGASNPNGAPIVIGTAAPHGYQTGQSVSISGVLGNTAANGTFTIAVVDAYTFTLDN
ncbi:MAG: Tc toxin subunit A, partial [Candidatus Sulfotelmatobacter sp.]